MNNADLPAMPLAKIIMSTDGSFSTETSPGLTKREYFAGLAMQGLLSASNMEGDWTGIDCAAIQAVKEADHLLSELEKTK